MQSKIPVAADTASGMTDCVLPPASVAILRFTVCGFQHFATIPS
jgi:hypothetical protein